MPDIIKQLSRELNISESQVRSTVDLIDKGNTIPFIARYRKEVTGGLNDTVLRDLFERLTYLRNLQSRQEEIIRLIEEQGKLTTDLIKKIESATTMTELEDLYRPYRPKRRTRAIIAREKGLKPLAEILWAQEIVDGDVLEIASVYVDPEKDVNTQEEALQGAVDIIAEIISDDAELRKQIRRYTFENGILITKALVNKSTVYEMYYDYSESVKRIVPHKVLAINRGEKENVLSVKIDVNREAIIERILKRVIRNDNSVTAPFVRQAAIDAYNRLIAPSIEREIRNLLTEKAEEQAIKVFGENLRKLLLQPPVKGKVVMGIDPGYRTGNKVAIIDETGKVMDTYIVYMTLPDHDVDKAKVVLKGLIEKNKVDVIAIGNGTASRETEIVIAELIKELDRKVYYTVVNEAGASVYSASPLGAEEFPDFDVALRSAVSIGRRLQDPLAELVKIDPKAIGVGQYQHDVNQKKLADTLRGVVEDCVNSVGVDVNTASASLLQYVAGISSTVAKNIVAYRNENGKFTSRQELMKVKKLGPKAFEQCAGFLRIPGAKNILDNTAVHPESYNAVFKLLKLKNYTLEDVARNSLKQLKQQIKDWDLGELSSKLGIGVPTLMDILNELQKPGRDPRDEFPEPQLRTDVMDIKDLKPGMILTGTVRNVVDFGVFVDIGIHQDGLVHISQLSNNYVKHPMDIVQVGDLVKVRVLGVDIEKKRISLTMKGE